MNSTCLLDTERFHPQCVLSPERQPVSGVYGQVSGFQLAREYGMPTTLSISQAYVWLVGH